MTTSTSIKVWLGSCLLWLGLSDVWSQDAPVLTEFNYAQNLQIEQFPTHRLITVWNVNRDSKQRFRYALVPKGNPLPLLPKDVTLVRTPVERVIVMSTTFIGYIDALNRLDTIIGASNPEFINNPTVAARLESGQTRSVQSGQSMDIERILLLQPDLILSSTTGDALFDLQPQLARSGLPIVLSAGYMEQHPLARAEWLHFIAAFFELEAEADSLLEGITQRYLGLTERVKNLEDRPTVFCNATYSGTWHLPGGNSYMARAIADSGGDYLWADDTSSGGIPLDLERIFAKAADADFWINPSRYQSVHQLLAADQRYAKFSAVQRGLVYNNIKQLSPNGGNNFWERGVVHADEVLADLIKIFHPSLMPEHEFNYYRQLR